MMDIKKLAQLIREKRGYRSLRVAAKEMGIKTATLSRFEHGKKPDHDHFIKLLDWLGYDIVKRDSDSDYDPDADYDRGYEAGVKSEAWKDLKIERLENSISGSNDAMGFLVRYIHNHLPKTESADDKPPSPEAAMERI